MALQAFRDFRALTAIRGRTAIPSTARYQAQAARALNEFCASSRLSRLELAALLARTTEHDVTPENLESWLAGDEEFPGWLVPAIADVARHRATTMGHRRSRWAMLAVMGLVAITTLTGVGAIAYYYSPIVMPHHGAGAAGGSSFMTPDQSPSQTASASPTASSPPGVPATHPVATRPSPTPSASSLQAPPVSKLPTPPPPTKPPATPTPTPVSTPTTAPSTPAPGPSPEASPDTHAGTAPSTTGGGGLGGLLNGVLGILGL